jgi:hypothetical protein
MTNDFGLPMGHLIEDYSIREQEWGCDFMCWDPTKTLTKNKVYHGYFNFFGNVVIEDDNGRTRDFKSDRFLKPRT